MYIIRPGIKNKNSGSVSCSTTANFYKSKIAGIGFIEQRLKANGKNRSYYKKYIYFYKDIGMGKVIEENDGWKIFD